MGMFSVDESPEYLRQESKLDMINKIIKEYDFLSDKEKITLIKCIINDKIKEVN